MKAEGGKQFGNSGIRPGSVEVGRSTSKKDKRWAEGAPFIPESAIRCSIVFGCGHSYDHEGLSRALKKSRRTPVPFSREAQLPPPRDCRRGSAGAILACKWMYPMPCHGKTPESRPNWEAPTFRPLSPRRITDDPFDPPNNLGLGSHKGRLKHRHHHFFKGFLKQ
jgi:hypothetical protein